MFLQAPLVHGVEHVVVTFLACLGYLIKRLERFLLRSLERNSPDKKVVEDLYADTTLFLS